jgi:hypothetical protein
MFKLIDYAQTFFQTFVAYSPNNAVISNFLYTKCLYMQIVS